MELKIKISINTINELGSLLEEIKKIKKECSIISTLILDIDIKY